MGRAGPNTSAGLLHLRMVVVRMRRSQGGGQDPGQSPHGVGRNGSVSVTVAFHWPLPRGNGTSFSESGASDEHGPTSCTCEIYQGKITVAYSLRSF